MGTRPYSRTGWSTNVVVPSEFAPFRALPTSPASPADVPLLVKPPASITAMPDPSWAPVAVAHGNERAPPTHAISARSNEDAGAWNRDVCQMQRAPPQRRVGPDGQVRGGQCSTPLSTVFGDLAHHR